MPIELGESTLRRFVKIYGIEGTALASINKDGIKLKASGPGIKLSIQISWPQIVNACEVPENVPSKFMEAPYEFLKNQISEQQKKAGKRLEKKVAQEIQNRQ